MVSRIIEALTVIVVLVVVSMVGIYVYQDTAQYMKDCDAKCGYGRWIWVSGESSKGLHLGEESHCECSNITIIKNERD